jgi:hypothetical protein
MTWMLLVDSDCWQMHATSGTRREEGWPGSLLEAVPTAAPI